MRFGINILNFGPGASPASLRRWVQFAEQVGFHLVMISDHVAITRDVQVEFPAPFYDPYIALSWIAGWTKKIALGTTVTILPYRHPLQTARIAANLDQLSGGRFIFGVGVGWAKEEFEALNIPFHRRGALANEYLEIIRMCWANDWASYDGEFISFNHIQTGPRPLRKTGPPIWVGGSSDAALKRAVRFGDAWHPYRVRVGWLKNVALPTIKRLAEEEEKPVPAICPRMTIRITDSSLPEHQRVAGEGSLEQIRADLIAMSEMNVPNVLLDTYTGNPEQTLHPEKDWKMLRILAENVLDLENEGLR